MLILPYSFSVLGAAIFVIALIHTFLASYLRRIGHLFAPGSVYENLFHLLGEVEIIFGFWAGIFVFLAAYFFGAEPVLSRVQSLRFDEPLLVFAVMVVAATKPIKQVCAYAVHTIAHLLPLPIGVSFFIVLMFLGPCLGSLITEPAAMTVTALLLRERFFYPRMPARFAYALLALLLVHISVGGTLTHYAAPPVLMVASAWHWDTPFMWRYFGYKACVGMLILTLTYAFYFRQNLIQAALLNGWHQRLRLSVVPWGMVLIHAVFLALIVNFSHYPVVFLGVFMFFLGFASVTQEYQDPLKIKDALLVAFFLSGLVVLGHAQAFWIQPLFTQLKSSTLFLVSIILTAFTDNAALTYLATLVDNLPVQARQAVVYGAVSGGGLTLIANAPNLIAYEILNDSMDGVNAWRLFLAAFIPTLVVSACLVFLP